MKKTTWQAEHSERQQRLVTAIGRWISVETAEALDQWDNTIRVLWMRAGSARFISAN